MGPEDDESVSADELLSEDGYDAYTGMTGEDVGEWDSEGGAHAREASNGEQEGRASR